MKKLQNIKWLLSGMLICILIPSLVFNVAMASTEGFDVPETFCDLRFEVEYDVFGREVRFAWYDTTGRIRQWCEFKYDSDGNVTRYSYDANGLLMLREERDAHGWFIRETRYNPDGSIDYWYEYILDENQSLIRTNFYNADGSIMRWIVTEEYGYDDDGNTVIRLTEYNADGSMNGTWQNTIIDNPNLNPPTGRFSCNPLLN